MEKIKDFSLFDQDGNKFTLSENLGQKILLVFYPKDDSLVCTKQLCNYNENFDKFLEKGIKVIGISIDNIDEHKQFHSKYKLKFPILSDGQKEVSKKYDALGVLGLAKRKLVLISETGEIINENYSIPLLYKDFEYILNNFVSWFIDLTFIINNV